MKNIGVVFGQRTQLWRDVLEQIGLPLEDLIKETEDCLAVAGWG